MKPNRYFHRKRGRVAYGICFYPYRWGLGILVRYWPCLKAPDIGFTFLCFKFWGYISFKDLEVSPYQDEETN
jgi:hypothetical protein